MEEDINKLPRNSKDQLYHILQTESFTLCLICFEDINTDHVRKHLKSRKHAESIKCMFKKCNPRLIDDIEEDRFTNMVLKSVFDISVLLGNEACYVCKNGNYWFCLMCEEIVTESNLDDVIVKDNIIGHVVSDCHVQKIEEVCYLYRFNTIQDFLLLNKSVVYCSICRDVTHCKEIDLLKTAVVHLEMKHTKSFKCEISSLVENEESKVTKSGCRFTDDVFSDIYLNIENITRTELSRKVKVENLAELYINDKTSVEFLKDNSMCNNVQNKDVNKSSNRKLIFSESNIFFCRDCKNKIKQISGQSFVDSLNRHFKKKHRKIYRFFKTSFEHLFERVIVHNNPDKIKLTSDIIRMKKDFIKLIHRDRKVNKHSHYIVKTKTDYLCILCLVSMSPCSDDNSIILERFQNHFNSSCHQQRENEESKVNKSFETYQQENTILKLSKKKEKLGTNDENLVEIAKDISMCDDVPNNKNSKKSFKIKPFFDEGKICICLLCMMKVTRVKGTIFLVSVVKHFRRSHRNFYIKTSFNDLMDSVIFLNSLEKINLISGLKILTKRLKKLISGSCEIKKDLLNYIFKTQTSYVCIICFVHMDTCLNDSTVELDYLYDHFNSLNHQQCERENHKINQAYKILEKNKTIVRLTERRNILKNKLQRKKAKRKSQTAKKNLVKLEQKKRRSNKLGGKHNIYKQVKKETVLFTQDCNMIHQPLPQAS